MQQGLLAVSMYKQHTGVKLMSLYEDQLKEVLPEIGNMANLQEL
jgi:hypothetical protein